MSLKKIVTLILLSLLIILFCKIDLYHYLTGVTQLWDFDVYYQTAIDVQRGINPYQLSYMQTAGPPLVIAPFFIFVVFKLETARSLMTLLSLLAVFGTSSLLSKQIFKKDPFIFSLILTCFFIILFQPRFNLLLGQPNLLLMFAVAYILTHASSYITTILKTLVITFKTHYIFSFLSMARRSHKNLALSVLSLCMVGILTLPVLKIENYRYYLSSRIEKHVAEPLKITDVGYYNQSLRATVARLGIPRSYFLFTIFILLVGGYFTYQTEDFSLGILLSLLISPIVWQHYAVVVYPIIFLTTLSYLRMHKLPWHILCASLLLFAHIPWLHEKSVSLVTGTLASHYYFGFLVLFYSRLKLVLTNKNELAQKVSLHSAR